MPSALKNQRLHLLSIKCLPADLPKKFHLLNSNSSVNLQQAVGKYNQPLLWLFFIASCIIGVITIYYHEMWRDESQAFLLVRDSKNLSELWQNVRYEGHPILWHFILFVAYRLFPSIYTIQVVHILTGLSVVALIIFYSPFSLLEKFLLSFSYFFSFEYLVISRNYSIGIFFLLLSVCIFKKRKFSNSIICIAILLGLAANSNIYSFIISCCLFAYFLFDSFLSNNFSSYKFRLFWLSSAIFTFFLAIALLQLNAPADRIPKLKISANIDCRRMGKISKEVSEVFFYMPDPSKKQKYWGFSVFEGKYFNRHFLKNLFFYLPQLLTLIFLILLFLTLKKSKPILLFVAGASIGLFMFVYLIFDRGLLRHTGAFFILLIIALWLYRSSYTFSDKSGIYFNYLFKTILLVQFAGSVIVHVYEIKYTFSGAKDAAAFLIKTHRNNDKIILHPDFEGMSLLHYGRINQVYYPTINERGSFIKFSDKRKPCSNEEIYTRALRDDIETMVFNNRKSDSIVNLFGYRLIYQPATTSTVSDENFWIYGKIKRQVIY